MNWCLSAKSTHHGWRFLTASCCEPAEATGGTIWFASTALMTIESLTSSSAPTNLSTTTSFPTHPLPIFPARLLPNTGPDGHEQQQPLPEIMVAGCTGVFRIPIHGLIHPSRPPCLELRPHPLRETQVGKFLKTISYMDKQLWVDQECSVGVWRFEDVLEGGLGGKDRRGDEDGAPLHESPNTSATTCVIVDSGNRLQSLRTGRSGRGRWINPRMRTLSRMACLGRRTNGLSSPWSTDYDVIYRDVGKGKVSHV